MTNKADQGLLHVYFIRNISKIKIYLLLKNDEVPFGAFLGFSKNLFFSEKISVFSIPVHDTGLKVQISDQFGSSAVKSNIKMIYAFIIYNNNRLITYGRKLTSICTYLHIFKDRSPERRRIK